MCEAKFPIHIYAMGSAVARDIWNTKGNSAEGSLARKAHSLEELETMCVQVVACINLRTGIFEGTVNPAPERKTKTYHTRYGIFSTPRIKTIHTHVVIVYIGAGDYKVHHWCGSAELAIKKLRQCVEDHMCKGENKFIAECTPV